jgi:hypothetical protein
MQAITDIIKDFIEESRTRYKSRVFSVFILSWLAINWQVIVSLIWTKDRTVSFVIQNISLMLHQTNWIYVILAMIIWLLLIPILDFGVNIFRHYLILLRIVKKETSMQKQIQTEKIKILEKEIIVEEHDKKMSDLKNQLTKITDEINQIRLKNSDVDFDNHRIDFYGLIAKVNSYITNDLSNSLKKEEQEKIKLDLIRNVQEASNQYTEALNFVMSEKNNLL